MIRTRRDSRVREPRLAATPRAVRRALAGSVAALALSASGLAFALPDIVADPSLVVGPQDEPVVVVNHEDVYVENGIALDVSAYAGVTVINDGSLVSHTDDFYVAIGLVALSAGGDVEIDNLVDGLIAADTSFTQSTGVFAFAQGDVRVDNTGAIEAHSDFGPSYGLDATSRGDIVVYNSGDIDAVTGANLAHGVTLEAYGAAYLDNLADGAIVADSEYNNASAVEILGGSVLVENYGLIQADGYFYATGALLRSYGGDLTLVNAGTLDASAEFEADAVILRTEGLGDAVLSNFGGIAATAVDTATAVFLASESQARLINFGTIEADGGDVATAVRLVGAWTYIENAGTIEASGALYNLAIDTSGTDSPDGIRNGGTITGAISTGDGDDFMFNSQGGQWNATGLSDFGSGDDRVYSHGHIDLNDATIELGTFSTFGNSFFSDGTVSVHDSSLVDMGGGADSLVPSANPQYFINGGLIDFQDGATDDTLLIVGDFAASFTDFGEIHLDVSGLDGSSDTLYIDGTVVDATVGRINVDLLDPPAATGTAIPMVYVSGDSTADNFVLGTVDWNEDGSFLALDFNLVADIDASNATPDVFALGISVSGLSDAGTIAASIPATVASLMNSQVGTWRQRMGVIDAYDKGGISLWARLFYDRGDVSPERNVGGNFDHEQFNSGAEGGVDFAVTDEFSLGLLVASSRGKSTLEDGQGSAKVDADTWGLYGTWISPNGFYLDASYRWMNFDVTTESSVGVLKGDGDAEAFNLELGYAWTLSGGLEIEPQLQYTHTSVDNLSILESSTGMRFENEDGDSSRGRVGVALRKAFGDADQSWLWTPYATLSAVREFDGESRFVVNDSFVGATTVEGTSALLELGATARHGNWSIYGGLNWQDGGAIDSLWGGQLGARYTFGHAAPAPAPVAPLPARACAEMDDDGDGIDNCNDRCAGTAASTQVGADGCPVPPAEPVMEAKPYRN